MSLKYATSHSKSASISHTKTALFRKDDSASHIYDIVFSKQNTNLWWKYQVGKIKKKTLVQICQYQILSQGGASNWLEKVCWKHT